jgi:hypothetical protein
MAIVAFLTAAQQDVVDRILDPLGEENVPPPSTGPPLWIRVRQAQAYGRDHPERMGSDEADPPHPSDDAYIVDTVYPE